MDPDTNDIEQDDSPRKDQDDAEEFVPGPQDPVSEADDSDEAIDDADEDVAEETEEDSSEGIN